MKLRMLDLFCKAGGAGTGYHQAGFDVVGCDLQPQKNYPFPFFQDDAMDVLRRLAKWGGEGCGYDVIHASPPCQAFSVMKNMPDARKHAELIEPVRDLLQQIGLPYVIENVVGAPLIEPIMLCGTMFDLNVNGFELRRHRLFESNMHLVAPSCRHKMPVIGVYGGHVRCRSTQFWRDTGADFPGANKKQLALYAMGYGLDDVMTMNELSEAVPPPYTAHIGSQLIDALEMAA